MFMPPLPSLPLRAGRVHEAFGPGAAGFAAIAASMAEGPVLWVREAWRPEILNPVGLAPVLDPGRVLLARPADQADALAVTEEALKDGAVPLVVLEVTRALDLREGRRLQLAAGAGRATGLCLIPEGMGSNAAETRWHCTPVFDAQDSTRQLWRLIKNKSGTIGAWHVRWDPQAHRLAVVSPVRE